MQAGMGTRSAADEAKQMGLTHAGYGYWKDNTGKVVAQTRDGELVMIDQTDGKMQPSQVDMGNPTGEASGQTPASKARSMGLISDGSGSYKDSQGNTIARTVNNELVFYDSRAGGGAVSDGSGGAQITQSSPSWVDPVTGLIVVPPAKPESPEEINAVPDATPATAPAGYDAFVNKKKEEMYQDNYVQNQIEQDVAQKEQEVASKYQSNPGSAALFNDLSSKMERAMQSGDAYKEDTAIRVKQFLEDEADKIVNDFESVEESDYEALTQAYTSLMITDARYQYWYDNIYEPISQDQSLSRLEKAEQRQIAKDDPDYGESRWGSMADHRKKVNDIVDAAVEKRMSAEEGSNTYQGEMINFTTKTMDPAKSIAKPKKILNLAKKTAEQNNEVVGDFMEIEWDNNEEITDPDQKRRAALDVLRTWRNDVLPDLAPGTVLVNFPMTGGRDNNQRERIYTMAGFGQFDEKLGGQFGMVVKDGRKNKIVPLGSTPQKSIDKLRESVMNYICDSSLQDEDVTYIYETIMQ